MSDPVTSARARRARDPRSQDLMVRYSGTPIRHTEFGIRKLEFGTGVQEIFMVRYFPS